MREDAKLDSVMTVADLIKALQYMDPDAPVVIATPSGDYWHTQLAVAVQSIDKVEGHELKWSEYHRENAFRSERELETRDEDEDEDEEEMDLGDVVVLNL